MTPKAFEIQIKHGSMVYREAKDMNRWQRLCLVNRQRWMTSLEQANAISSTTISNFAP